MAFKSRRQARYAVLINYGLLAFEARELSRLSLAEMRYTPYIRDFIRMRSAWAERVPDRVEYARQIMEHYQSQGWIKQIGWYTAGDIWEWINDKI